MKFTDKTHFTFENTVKNCIENLLYTAFCKHICPYVPVNCCNTYHATQLNLILSPLAISNSTSAFRMNDKLNTAFLTYIPQLSDFTDCLSGKQPALSVKCDMVLLHYLSIFCKNSIAYNGKCTKKMFEAVSAACSISEKHFGLVLLKLQYSQNNNILYIQRLANGIKYMFYYLLSAWQYSKKHLLLPLVSTTNIQNTFFTNYCKFNYMAKYIFCMLLMPYINAKAQIINIKRIFY